MTLSRFFKGIKRKKLKKRIPIPRKIYETPEKPFKIDKKKKSPIKPLQMSVVKNAINFLQAQHAIELCNVKKDLLLSRFEIFNLKNYVKFKTIQQMHIAIAKKIKMLPNFLRKLVKVFLPMSRMEFKNLFLPDVDFRQFVDAKRSKFSCEISITRATSLGLYVPDVKILHPPHSCNDPQCLHQTSKLISTAIRVFYHKWNEKLKMVFGYEHFDEFGIKRYING